MFLNIFQDFYRNHQSFRWLKTTFEDLFTCDGTLTGRTECTTESELMCPGEMSVAQPTGCLLLCLGKTSQTTTKITKHRDKTWTKQQWNIANYKIIHNLSFPNIFIFFWKALVWPCLAMDLEVHAGLLADQRVERDQLAAFEDSGDPDHGHQRACALPQGGETCLFPKWAKRDLGFVCLIYSFCEFLFFADTFCSFFQEPYR